PHGDGRRYRPAAREPADLGLDGSSPPGTVAIAAGIYDTVRVDGQPIESAPVRGRTGVEEQLNCIPRADLGHLILAGGDHFFGLVFPAADGDIDGLGIG